MNEIRNVNGTDKLVFERGQTVKAQVDELRRQLHFDKYPVLTKEAWQRPMCLYIMCGNDAYSEDKARLVYFNMGMQDCVEKLGGKMEIERVPLKRGIAWRVAVTWQD